MNRRRLFRQLGTLAGIGALGTLGATSIPGVAAQPPVADFPAPLSPAAARAVVQQAQHAEYTRRVGLAQQLGVVRPELLPRFQNVYTAVTGQHISDRVGFLSYWRSTGGALIHGYPITGEIVEDGQIVQYFEHARFEYHPDKYGTDRQVMRSLLGSQLFGDQGFPPATAEMGERFFPETRHTLSGRFRRYWEKRGGIDIFGFPISEPLEEVSPTDGQLRTAQYFERARFEHVPEDMDGFYRQMEAYNGIMLATLHEIRLLDLGRQAALQRGHAVSSTAQRAGVPEWSPAIWPRRIMVNLSQQWLYAFEGSLQVYQAPVATGKDGFNTPTGSYAIYTRYPMQTMVGAAAGETWTVPDIPWVQYVVGGVALHGTYWHDVWGSGVRMSHGCVNLNIDDARWLYEWADVGTPVDITY